MSRAISILKAELNDAKSDLNWAIEYNDEDIKNDRLGDIAEITEAIKILETKLKHEAGNKALNLQRVMPCFSSFYKELEERMLVLEAKKESEITDGRILELQLTTLRVQQILLSNLNKA